MQQDNSPLDGTQSAGFGGDPQHAVRQDMLACGVASVCTISYSVTRSTAGFLHREAIPEAPVPALRLHDEETPRDMQGVN